MTFNTGNPIGSTAPEDLYDNAENIDQWANGEQPFHPDRLGVPRRTLAGMQDAFEEFLARSNYDPIGDYTAGIEVTARNQVILAGGEYWAVVAATELPYVTTGAGMPEGGAFASVGDAVLRSDLASLDVTKGAALVGRGVVAVDSIASLIDTQQRADLRYLVTSYHPDSDVGGGEFYWSPETDKSEHNGCTVIDPDAPFSELSWYTSANEGQGCFVRLPSESISLFAAGKRAEAHPETDHLAWKAAVRACKRDRDITEIIIPDVPHRLRCTESGSFSYGAAIELDGLESVHFKGSGYNQAVMPATGGGGASGFSLVRAQNCNNIEFSGFRIDGDFANFDNGQAGTRSGAFIFSTFNRETLAPLQPMSGIHVHHIQCDNIGGFVWVSRLTATHAPEITNIKLNDNWGLDAAFVNNCITLSICKKGEVKRNKFTNTPYAGSPVPTLFVDVSRGCESVSVEDNEGRFFVFGMKSEIAPAGSPSFLPSKNISFRRNRLIEIGDPLKLSAGEGSAAGGTYGIKVYSSTVEVVDNFISERVQNRSGGGLSSGIYAQFAADTVEGVTRITGNTIEGCVTGILQGRAVSDGKAPTFIMSNILRSTRGAGIIIQADCTAQDNTIIGSSTAGVSIQIAANSRVVRNTLINCGSTNSPPLNQGDGGSSTAAGYFEFLDNNVIETRTSGFPNHAYFLQAGLNYTVPYRLRMGRMETASNPMFGAYVGLFDRTDIKASGQVNGVALVHLLSYNIASVTSVDANTVQVNFRRNIDSALPFAGLVDVTGGKRLETFGTAAGYVRVRFRDSSSGALTSPGTFNVHVW